MGPVMRAQTAAVLLPLIGAVDLLEEQNKKLMGFYLEQAEILRNLEKERNERRAVMAEEKGEVFTVLDLLVQRGEDFTDAHKDTMPMVKNAPVMGAIVNFVHTVIDMAKIHDEEIKALRSDIEKLKGGSNG